MYMYVTLNIIDVCIQLSVRLNISLLFLLSDTSPVKSPNEQDIVNYMYINFSEQAAVDCYDSFSWNH